MYLNYGLTVVYDTHTHTPLYEINIVLSTNTGGLRKRLETIIWGRLFRRYGTYS